ncbi:putative product [Salmonella enterica subsp. enterica serovar Typhimurium str. DT2]|nr:putative product [Salmonella enterica subsp. enterica serovar Typhimurium str. DT2]
MECFYMATLREMLSPRYTTRYEDLLQVKWQVYPDFHIPDVMEPQPHRMQERAAASWRSFDSASIEWLPVAADFTCSR